MNVQTPPPATEIAHTMLISAHTNSHEQDGITYHHTRLFASVGPNGWVYTIGRFEGKPYAGVIRDTVFVQAAHENGFIDETLVTNPTPEEKAFYLECAEIIKGDLLFSIGEIKFYDRESFQQSLDIFRTIR